MKKEIVTSFLRKIVLFAKQGYENSANDASRWMKKLFRKCGLYDSEESEYPNKAQNASCAKDAITVNAFQKMALETANYDRKYGVMYPALGLAEEAGEVVGKVKKTLRDNAGVFSDERKNGIALEIGDVMWYCAVLADELGYSLGEICLMNYEKLQSRKERGVLGGSGDNR